jgi:hypothetical protein
MSLRFPGIAAFAAVAVVGLAGQACAETLIGFADADPATAVRAPLGVGTLPGAGVVGYTAYESWTQTVSVSNVSVSALIGTTSDETALGHWLIVREVGPAFDLFDVVASGAFVAPHVASEDVFDDFNGAPLTVLGSGVHLDPGRYFLVLTSAGEDWPIITWAGGHPGDMTESLAPGFSLAEHGSAVAPGGAVGPAVGFTASPNIRLDYRLAGKVDAAIPEPAAWALMLAGFGLAGAALRRAPIRAAA